MSAAGGRIGSRCVHSAGTVRCRSDAGHVTVSVEGSLDHETASALLHTVAHELTSNPNRIDVDLRQVTSFVAPGAEALGQCRELCSDVDAGLHFRTDGGAGQHAVLAAFESRPLTEPD